MELPNDANDLSVRAVDLQDTVGLVDTINRIISSAIEYVSDATHATLTVRLRGSFISLGSSSAVAGEADDLQYELDEGPTVDAFGKDAWYRSGDLAHDERWPRWGPGAAELGLSSAVSMRFAVEGRAVAALTLYSPETGLFSDPAKLDLAVLYGSHAGIALNQVRLLDGLEVAVESRHTIGKAQGILMERFGLGEDESFAALRRLSQTTNTKLSQVAAGIVTTRKLPTV